MKIFQKLMSLVLIVAMVCSFSFAENYKDEYAITQTEAIDVMSALGVMEGYPDGTVNPTGNVTRAEMAKMAAFILNKGEDIGAMYAGACTFADTASHWASGYVAYCTQEGIINGKNATTFDPDAPITGTEAAKIVLGMLGHDGDKAGLIGSSWASTTLSLTKKNNLIGEVNGLTANMNTPLSRQDTARLLLNGLQAPMVEYSGGTNITIGNVVLVQGATPTVLTDGTGVLQLMEECFPTMQGLRLNKATDSFGRACNEWNYKNELIGFYSVAPWVSYTTEITLGQLYTDLGKIDAAKLTGGITYYVDGEDVTATIGTKMQNLKSGNYLDKIGGQGVVTEVYFDEITMSLIVVEINVYAGTITQVNEAKRDANGDIAAEAYINVAPVAGAKHATAGWTLMNGYSTGANTALTDIFTYADRNTVIYYTIGDNVAVTGYQPQMQYVGRANAITGVNNGWAILGTKATHVNIDSTTYAVNASASYAGGTFGQSETIYLDYNNNVIYSTGVASSDYCYMVMAAKTHAFADNYSAQIITDDGTQKVVELSNAHNGGNGVTNSGIYTYVIDSDGKYTLTYRNTQTTNSVTNKTPSIGTDIANNTTKFIVGVTDNVYNTVYTSYTGVSMVPSFTGITHYAIDTTTGNVAVVFCLDATMTGVSTNSVMVLYKTGLESYVTAGMYDKYYAVSAIVDDKITSVKVNDVVYNALNTGFNFTSGGMIDSYGTYTSTMPLSAYHTATAFTSLTPYQNGNVVFDTSTYYVENTTPAYVWNKTTNTLIMTQIDALYNVTSGHYVLINPAVLGTPYIHAVYATVEY